MKVNCLLLLICVLSESAFAQQTDSYGGLLTHKGESGKYFHIDEIAGRQMLVTPEGHGFFTLGINHIGDTKGERPVEIVDDLFDGDTKAYIDDAVSNLKKWNYNTVGYHNPWTIRKEMVSMADVYLIKCANYHSSREFSYPDVFDAEFKAQTRKKIDNMTRGGKENRNIIGYYWSDTPQWDIKRAREKRGTDWVTAIRSLGKDSAGKKRYIDFLKERFKDDGEKVKLRYNLKTSDWEQMLSESFALTNLDKPEILKDDYAFLGVIAAEFYKDMGEATRNADPDRLIFGERFLVGDHPKEVLDEAVKWIDVISYQPGGKTFNPKRLDEIWERYGKPIMLCDHSISFETDAFPDTMWNQVESGKEAGRLITAYKLDAIKKPYIIGYHRCQYISRLVSKGNPQLKQGVLQTDAKPYQEFALELTEGNKRVLKAFADFESR